MEQLDAFTPPHKPAARRLTLLLNLSANQVDDLVHATAGQIEPIGDHWRRLERLIERGLLDARMANGLTMVTCTLTPFGKCALEAYRAAEKAGLLKEVA